MPEAKKDDLVPFSKDHPLRVSLENSRTTAVVQLMSLLCSPIRGQRSITYLQSLLDHILESEFLTGKFLDKLMPTLTPEQTNVLMQNFETRILAMQGGDAPVPVPSLGMGIPIPPAIDMSVLEPSEA